MAGTVSGAYLASLGDSSAGLANRMASFKDVLSKSGVESFALARQGMDETLNAGTQSAVQGAAAVGSELVRQNTERERNIFNLVGKAYELDAVARDNERARQAAMRRDLIVNLAGGLGELRAQSRQLPAAPSALANAQANVQSFNDLSNALYSNPLYRDYLAKVAAGIEGVNQPAQTRGGVLE